VPDGFTYSIKYKQARRLDKKKLDATRQNQNQKSKVCAEILSEVLPFHSLFACMRSTSVVLLPPPSNSRAVDACGPKLIPCHTDRNCIVTELSEPSCRAVSRRRGAMTAVYGNERFASVKCVGKEFETLNGLPTGPHQTSRSAQCKPFKFYAS
jgi:hypothetical protein